VAQKFGRIENFAPSKTKGSRMPLVRAVYHDWLRRVAARSNHGRNDGGQGAQLPGRWITMMAPNDCGECRKVLTMSQELQCSTFASERPHVRTWGRQTCFLPRTPSNLVTPLTVIQYSSVLQASFAWNNSSLYRK